MRYIAWSLPDLPLLSVMKIYLRIENRSFRGRTKYNSLLEWSNYAIEIRNAPACVSVKETYFSCKLSKCSLIYSEQFSNDMTYCFCCKSFFNIVLLSHHCSLNFLFNGTPKQTLLSEIPHHLNTNSKCEILLQFLL